MNAQDKPGAPPVGKFVEAGDGVTVHLHDLGDAANPAVVFVHGSGPGASGWSNFKQNVDAFVAAGYRVIVPDLLGYGFTSKPTEGDYTLDRFAKALKGALDALNIKSATLVGNSLGGAISIRIALDHPGFVNKLIMMAPGGIEELDTYMAMEGIQAMMSGFLGGTLDAENFRKLLTQLVHDPKHITPELVQERTVILEEMPQEVLGTMRVPNQEAELKNLACPVLVFWGTNDRFCPSSGHTKFLEHVKPSRVVLVNECGHWVMVEHADLFDRTCIDFLKNG